MHFGMTSVIISWKMPHLSLAQDVSPKESDSFQTLFNDQKEWNNKKKISIFK